MEVETPVAFAVEELRPSGVEIRINFGILAGRPAPPAEIDALGRDVLALVPNVTIVAEQHYAIGRGGEGVVDLVKLVLDVDEAPQPAPVRELVAVATAWAEACAAERHATV